MTELGRFPIKIGDELKTDEHVRSQKSHVTATTAPSVLN